MGCAACSLQVHVWQRRGSVHISAAATHMPQHWRRAADPSCGGNCYSDGDAVLPTAINFCSACPAGYWAAMPGRDDCQPW